MVSVLAVTAWPTLAPAQVLDAPTGTYTGTRVHERRLTWKQTDSPRVVAYETETKVTGFGHVPTGGTRTFIRLIMPPRSVLDRGFDRQLGLDFNADPPVFEVADGQDVLAVPFPTVAVDGTTVTVETSVTLTTPDYESADVNTLTLKRTKP